MRNLITLAALSVALLGCDMKMNEDALPLMNDGQRATVEVLHTFSSATTPEEINKHFGDPKKVEVGGVRMDWQIEHEGKVSVVRAYFFEGKLNHVKYLSTSPLWGYGVYYSADATTDEDGT